MPINSNTITNLAFTAACGTIVVLGGMQIWDRISIASTQVPSAIADLSPTHMSIASAPTQGDTNAKVALVEFSDFQCPFCAQYTRGPYEQIRREFVTSGKVKYALVNLPLTSHQNARDAAAAGECAHAQERFWPMHDRLFANQQQLSPADLIAHAKEIGLDSQMFAACLDTHKSLVNDDVKLAGEMGVQSTPTFLIGTINADGTVRVTKKIVGARSVEVFRQALNDVMSE